MQFHINVCYYEGLGSTGWLMRSIHQSRCLVSSSDLVTRRAPGPWPHYPYFNVILPSTHTPLWWRHLAIRVLQYFSCCSYLFCRFYRARGYPVLKSIFLFHEILDLPRNTGDRLETWLTCLYLKLPYVFLHRKDWDFRDYNIVFYTDSQSYVIKFFLILEGGRVNSNRNENVKYKNNVNNLYYHLPMTDDSHPFSFW